MIAYVDSSVLARAYLSDEEGHSSAAALLTDLDLGVITGGWSRIEVSGAIVRAGRAGRCDSPTLLAALDEDLDVEGPVTVMAVPQPDVEEKALDVVREHGCRAMDAWHLAVAALILPELAEAGETPGFATRDAEQGRIAETLGFQVI